MIDKLENLTEALNQKIDKSKWKTWKFSELVENINIKIKPKDSGLVHYIGLEHLDSDSLHIRRFGETATLDGDKLKICKGDLIFAKRNAYLKRVAIAEIDAAASAHSLVLRAKPSNILPEFLPFFMLSETFWRRAIEISVGSLSPTINWPSLAKQEFLLPPKELQAEMAELFWAIDDLVESQRRLLVSSNEFFRAQKNHAVLNGKESEIEYSDFIRNTKAKNWFEKTIGKLLSEDYLIQIQDGNHGELHPKSSDYIDDGIPFVMANTFSNGEIDFGVSKKLPQEITDKLRIGFSFPGDLLLSHKGTVGEVALVPKTIKWPYLMLTPQVTYYRVNTEKLSARFLFYVFSADYFQRQLHRVSSQSTRAYVGITAQRSLRIVIPDTKREQDEIVELLNATRKTIEGIDATLKSTKLLFGQLINRVF